MGRSTQVYAVWGHGNKGGSLSSQAWEQYNPWCVPPFLNIQKWHNFESVTLEALYRFVRCLRGYKKDYALEGTCKYKRKIGNVLMYKGKKHSPQSTHQLRFLEREWRCWLLAKARSLSFPPATKIWPLHNQPENINHPHLKPQTYEPRTLIWGLVYITHFSANAHPWWTPS